MGHQHGPRKQCLRLVVGVSLARAGAASPHVSRRPPPRHGLDDSPNQCSERRF